MRGQSLTEAEHLERVADDRPDAGRRGSSEAADAADLDRFKQDRQRAVSVSEACDESEILALLHDEYARAILGATSERAMSASELSDSCDASRSTIYRRIDRLTECDLLEEQTQLDPDGHHRNVYASRLEEARVRFEDGDPVVEIERTEPVREDPADRFTRMWEDL